MIIRTARYNKNNSTTGKNTEEIRTSALQIVSGFCYKYINRERFKVSHRCMKELIESIFQISKEGKVLSVFCEFKELFPTELMSYLKKRCELTKLYLKYLKEISEKLNNKGINYYIFKTIKPFPYDLTDIDILFIDKYSMLATSKVLMKKFGFKAVSKGTYSITLRKTSKGFDIDVDLQLGVSAGTFRYLSILEMQRAGVEIGFFKGSISMLRPELELAILAGHAIFKDFSISLANIIYSDYLLKNSKKHILSTIIGHDTHLAIPLETLFSITHIFKEFIRKSHSRFTNIDGSHKFLIKHIVSQFKMSKGIFTVPLMISTDAYLKTFTIFLKKHNYDRILEILMLPQSRGIRIFFRRLGLLPYEETIKA